MLIRGLASFPLTELTISDSKTCVLVKNKGLFRLDATASQCRKTQRAGFGHMSVNRSIHTGRAAL